MDLVIKMKLNSTSLSYIIARVRYQDGQGIGGQVTIPSSDNRSLEDLTLITVYRKLNLKKLKSKSRFNLDKQNHNQGIPLLISVLN